ncbi:hypothetical protein QE152_g267 [Popillia japonica]|uniref:Uncharacterized protein n=1 Tax=Popillia japonica TaxID=7064 RepID=A0AAW1NKE1_POPJA
MLLDLQREPSEKFENFSRMSAADFECLLNKNGPKIKKQDTNMRQAIPVKDRLAITLRFLASSDTKVPRKPSQQTKDIQREFAEYFITNGTVGWQNYVN